MCPIMGKKGHAGGGTRYFALSYFGLAAAVSMREVFALFAVYGLYHGLTDGAARPGWRSRPRYSSSR